MVAAIRPTDWNWILLFHLLTAFALVGGMITVVMASLAVRGSRPEHVLLLRVIAFRTTLIVVIPMFVLIHVFGPWLADREYPRSEPDWLSNAFAITTIATLVTVLLALLQFWALRRLRARRHAAWPEHLSTWLPLLVLASLIAVIVLMAGKPS